MFKKSILYSVVLGAVFSAGIFAHPEFEEEEKPKWSEKKIFQRHNSGMQNRDGMQTIGGLRRALSQLDLDDEQQKLLKTLREDNKQKLQATRSEIRPLKKQMHNLLSSDNIDEAAVKDLSRQIADKKSEQMLLMASIRQQAIAILSDEQKADLEEMRSKRLQKMKKMNSHG